MTPPSGRTNWLAKDTGWWRRGRIVALGLEFGPAGPAVIDWLTCEAKMQNDSGWVKTGNLAVAHGCFVELVQVCPILSRSVELGLLDEFEGSETVFTCRISGWHEDQEKPLAAAKKAAQRVLASVEKPSFAGETPKGQNGTDGDTSHVVPVRPQKSPTGQDKTEQEELHPPTPQGGNRQRDRLLFDEEVQAYTRALGIEHEDGWHNVRGAIESGKARTNDEVLAWVRKHRPDILPQEMVA